jgi:hypothetical protein
MQVAKIEEGFIKIADTSVLFPYSMNVNEAFLRDNGCMPLNAYKPHDPKTHKLVSCYPYIEGDWVYTVEVVEVPEEEAAEQEAIKRAKFVAEVSRQAKYALDDFASKRGYDDITTACTYATSTNAVYKAEGQHAVDMRDMLWEALSSIIADVKSGAREIPSGYESIKSELPILGWE